MRRFKLIFFLTLILSVAKDIRLYAQNPQLDSLKLALKNAKHDTTRCNILSVLVEFSDESEWPRYNKMLLRITSEKLQVSSNTLSENILYKRHYASALNNEGNLAVMQGETDQAMDLYKKCMKIQAEIKDNKGMAGTLNNIGYLYDQLGNTNKALEYYLKSLESEKLNGDKKGIASSLVNLGTVYIRRGEISKALDCYSLCMKLQEETGHRDGLAHSLSNLGYIYELQGEFNAALEYYAKSLKIREELKDKPGISACLNSIGSIYHTRKEFGEAEKHYLKSLELREAIGNNEDLATSIINLGVLYQDLGELEKAENYYLKGLRINESIDNKEGVARALNNLGAIYSEKKNNAKALEYCTKSLKLSTAFGFPESIEHATKNLWTLHKELGNHKLALENYELYIKMRDSLNNIETQKATIKQQTKYEYDKQKAVADEKHLAEIKQQEEKAAAEKKRQNIIIGSVSVVLLLIAVFSVILFNRFRVTQKQKAVIEKKEIETRNQKHIIEEKHKEITDSINYAERIQRSFLATELHLNQHLSEYFVLFQPKDVVSGDFYWSATLNNGNFALATADSTGHGVPGAIMSLLNITSLEKAIETETEPNKILDATRKIIIERLKKDGSAEGGKDGMDCSLCVYDQKNLKLFVSAANNPVWIVRRPDTEALEVSTSQTEASRTSASSVVEALETTTTKNVIEVKADKMPVGKHDKQDIPFTQHEIQLQKGDVVYTLTDGFPDQFGGEKGKKFMSKNLRELLAKNAHLPMDEQRSLLEKTFKDWVGELEQVDDVTVIGIRV